MTWLCCSAALVLIGCWIMYLNQFISDIHSLLRGPTQHIHEKQ